jgi:hypothetical protein
LTFWSPDESVSVKSRLHPQAAVDFGSFYSDQPKLTLTLDKCGLLFMQKMIMSEEGKV